MTDTTNNPTKTKALELAIQGGGTPAEVVARATAYHNFLSGGPQVVGDKATGGAPAGGAAKPGAGAQTGKPAAAAGAAKPGAQTGAPAGGKPAAGKGQQQAAKPGAQAGAGKPSAAAGANGAAKPGAQTGKPAAAAGAATGAAVPPDTKAPNGKFTYGDMTARMRLILNTPLIADPAERRVAAQKVLQDTSGVKAVRDCPAAKYDAVVAAADAYLKSLEAPQEAATGGDDDLLGDPPEHTGGGQEADGPGFEDPTEQPERNDMGL